MKNLGQRNTEKFRSEVNTLTSKLDVRALAYRLGDVSPKTFDSVDSSDKINRYTKFN
jgi:hypothetical protein